MPVPSPVQSIKANTTPLVFSVCAVSLGGVVGVTLGITGLAHSGQEFVTSGQATAELELVGLLSTNASVLMILILGGLLMGVPTLIVLFQNGLVIGLLAGAAATSGELWIFLALTVPHATFELPAFWIAGCVGLKLPFNLGEYLLERRDSLLCRRDLVHAAVLLSIAFALVALGAVVESEVTARIARRL
ncbi:hypothetical protein BRC83_08520 [Halobacteriales archaeon QS_1_68_17]|nr:MAG: hypothetical protein BRC83_08520 [Halobacteriales archaeon QS_1_68_17]